MKTPHRILPILALSAAFAIGLGVARAADEGGAKKDNPEANAGPKDNPEAKAGPKDSPEGKKGGEGDAKPAAAAQNSKEGKVFVAYDKDKNGTVSAEEIEGMLEGSKTPAAAAKSARESTKPTPTTTTS